MALERRDGTQLVTMTQGLGDVRWLGSVGHVNATKYSYVVPGGCDQLSASLMLEATARNQATEPGRIVRGYRGGSMIWEGILQESQPTDAGWQLTAIGAGNYGTNSVGYYTSMWPFNEPDEAINNAIGRGMRWANPGVGSNSWPAASGTAASPAGGTTLATSTVLGAGTFAVSWIVGFSANSAGTAAAAENNNFQLLHNGSVVATATVNAVANGLDFYTQLPVTMTVAVGDTISVKTVGGATANITYLALIPPAGVWLGQQVDSAAQTITELLNLNCTAGGLTWYVTTNRYANTLKVFPLPTVANRLLIANSPVARTMAAAVNTVFERYEISGDTVSASGGTADVAQYGTTFSIDQASHDRYGPQEVFLDLSQSGVISAASAQAAGTNMLKRFLRASFNGPFTVGPRQLLTMGGQETDIGMEQAGTVAQLILTDFAFGGETSLRPPITFLVGGYQFDDDSWTATVTPFQYLASSFQNLLGAASTMLPSAFTDT